MSDLNPTYWKALHKFCMSVGADDAVNKNETQAKPLSEKDRKFLTDAMSEFAKSTDPVVRLKCELDILKALHLIRPQSEHERRQIVCSLENVEELACDLDMAHNLIKVHGMPIITPALTSTDASVRAGASAIVGQMAQNNPACQKYLVEAGMMPALLAALEHDEDLECKAKALYAVSSVCRGSAEGHGAFTASDGYGVITRLLSTEAAINDRLLTKVLFLLAALVTEYGDDTPTLFAMGYMDRAFMLLHARCAAVAGAAGPADCTSEPWREHALRLCAVLAAAAKGDGALWQSEVADAKWNDERMEVFLRQVVGSSEQCLEEERSSAAQLLAALYDEAA